MKNGLPSAINIKCLSENTSNKILKAKLNIRYANIWMRFLAYITDLIILFFLGIFFGFLAAYLVYSTGVTTDYDDLVGIGGLVWFNSICGFLLPLILVLLKSPLETNKLHLKVLAKKLLQESNL